MIKGEDSSRRIRSPCKCIKIFFTGLSFAIWINAENQTTVTNEYSFYGILTTTKRTVINGTYHSNMGFRVIFMHHTGAIVFWLFVNESVVTKNFFARRYENLSPDTW